ncbi:DnaD domain-containing protein [Streptococcus sobrinus]|uniref:DnaD domain protein n=2 Tax=Streptococcus sobrinus TaxID=1310 RepID=U2KML9_9STRE|nr:DnaD domain-containing protein [Streptococcus sobrinus]AWN18685.1 DnaD domain protein [Streptococcus sobrinus]AWN21008.1 DnaD domain protein [Streptococcus sobrinus]AWN61845.1 DnaD domain protein [Streptococcus sobrinus]AWN63716.1 DnaD domain protein [Streptococcus sobrinus]EMP71815.1 DNA replication protein DnaD [Streptococcus sobrinus DSM 20742 = ATCC 33478]
MTFLDNYQKGNLVLPSSLLFHFKDIFSTADDYLVWQFFYLQNTTKIDEMPSSRVADALGKTVAEVNQAISNLTNQELLVMKTIELDGETDIIFDASPVLQRLDDLLNQDDQGAQTPLAPLDNANDLQALINDFEKSGWMLTPFELEDLQKYVREDGLSPDLIREALKESIFNSKRNWKYLTAILRRWTRDGITTVRQIEERRQERDQANPSKVQVSDDFLNAMNLWNERE